MFVVLSVSVPLQGILQAVPSLWEEAKEEELMMGAVLVTITRLVQAIGASVTAIGWWPGWPVERLG